MTFDERALVDGWSLTANQSRYFENGKSSFLTFEMVTSRIVWRHWSVRDIMYLDGVGFRLEGDILVTMKNKQHSLYINIDG